MAAVMPVIFLGHGNPMNALLDNRYTRGWAAIGAAIPRPRGIVSVSAHWYVPFTAVTVMRTPRTIHDFGGFPRELYAVRYPAPGDPALARRVRNLLGPLEVSEDESWGLDHGTWSVLRHVFPGADVPVVQLAIDESQAAIVHYEIAARLAPLRDEGILVVGSGNLVHNLHAYAWGRHAPQPYDWAVSFEAHARELLTAGDNIALVEYESLGADALLAVPTPDHYLPLLYVIALRRPGDRVTFPVDGVDGGSISMLSVQIG